MSEEQDVPTASHVLRIFGFLFDSTIDFDSSIDSRFFKVDSTFINVIDCINVILHYFFPHFYYKIWFTQHGSSHRSRYERMEEDLNKSSFRDPGSWSGWPTPDKALVRLGRTPAVPRRVPLHSFKKRSQSCRVRPKRGTLLRQGQARPLCKRGLLQCPASMSGAARS